MRHCDKSACATELPDAQVVDTFQRRPTDTTDYGVAIATHQRVGDGAGAGGTVEFGGGFGHTRYCRPDARMWPVLFWKSIQSAS